MWRLNRSILVWALIVAVSCQPAVAATWSYHPHLSHNPPHWYNTGTLDVWGTINCVPQDPPLFHGHVESCHTYSGYLPTWANDYGTRLVQDGCGNTYYTKTAVARWEPGPPPEWYFLPLAEWVDTYVDAIDPVVLPSLGDPTGEWEVYAWVYLDQWYEVQPEELEDTYAITDGLCAELPYHRFSSTPFEFRPDAPSDEDPFYWTPLTGTFENGATINIVPEPVPGDLDGDGDVDHADLGILLADWGCTGGNCPGDCDGDGDTDSADLGILLANWGYGT